MNALECVFGEICRVLLPIPEEVCFGNRDSSIVVCTLSSIPLLREISDSDLLDSVAVVGRLFSENRGIDALVRFVNSNRNIRTLVLCGEEVRGHRAGDSLMALYENGIDDNGRIVSSKSPDPFLKASKDEVGQFRDRVTVVNKIGETDPDKIKALVNSLRSQ